VTGRVHPEAGDTLIEVLIAIAILGITVTALLGALVTTITSASEHRSLASLDTTLRSYAEQLKYDVQLQGTSSWFTQCANVSSSPPQYQGHTVTPANQPPNVHYSVVILGIKYWNDATNMFDTNCSAPGDRSGFQLVTFQATAPNGLTEPLSVGVRTP
jgi:type II secretory pathway pseudopilin PulG